MSAHLHGKAISLPYYTMVIFEQLTPLIKTDFPADMFHEITQITNALKRNAHDQNEQITQQCFSLLLCLEYQRHLTDWNN